LAEYLVLRNMETVARNPIGDVFSTGSGGDPNANEEGLITVLSLNDDEANEVAEQPDTDAIAEDMTTQLLGPVIMPEDALEDVESDWPFT
jgi:hypothetical protein